MTSGGTNFHIRHNSKLDKIKATDAKSSSSLISMLQSAYESASGDVSVPFLRVENCDLYGNLIVSTPRWNQLRRGHDRVTVQIALFDTQ